MSADVTDFFVDWTKNRVRQWALNGTSRSLALVHCGIIYQRTMGQPGYDMVAARQPSSEARARAV